MYEYAVSMEAKLRPNQRLPALSPAVATPTQPRSQSQTPAPERPPSALSIDSTRHSEGGGGTAATPQPSSSVPQSQQPSGAQAPSLASANGTAEPAPNATAAPVQAERAEGSSANPATGAEQQPAVAGDAAVASGTTNTAAQQPAETVRVGDSQEDAEGTNKPAASSGESEQAVFAVEAAAAKEEPSGDLSGSPPRPVVAPAATARPASAASTSGGGGASAPNADTDATEGGDSDTQPQAHSASGADGGLVGGEKPANGSDVLEATGASEQAAKVNGDVSASPAPDAGQKDSVVCCVQRDALCRGGGGGVLFCLFRFGYRL